VIVRRVSAVHEKCVQKSILVVINPGHARAHRLRIKALRRRSSFVMEMNSRRAGHVVKFHVVRIGDLAAVPEFYGIILGLSCGFTARRSGRRRRRGLPIRRRNQGAIRRARRWPQQSAGHVRGSYNNDRKQNEQRCAKTHSLPGHCGTDSNSTPFRMPRRARFALHLRV
jgi:hypothetical protein